MQTFRRGLPPRIPNAVKRINTPSRHIFTRINQTPRTPVRTGLFTVAFALSTGLFAVYYFDARSALHRYVLTPVLRNVFDAETSHKIAVKVLRTGLGPRDPLDDDPCLKSQVWGHEISNPIGLAAGFDKNGEAVDGLFNLGFSWVEIGSVTPKPQSGNPRPRIFHLPEDSGVINRYGFPSQGHASVLSRLRARISPFETSHENCALRPDSVLAVNLGKNKESSAESIDDFIQGVRSFGSYCDVLVVNVSSPNTPGLRRMQNRQLLEALLNGVAKARDELPVSSITSKRPKLLVKLAPDLEESQLIEIAEVIRSSGIDGVIVSNTTIQRPNHLISSNQTEPGGLSGKPVKKYSLKALQTLRSQLPSSIVTIGCGGIFTGADALDFARAGASLVQVYTGFGYDGVGFCRRIKDELRVKLAEEGTTWDQVVKQAVDELSFKSKDQPSESQILHKLISEAKDLQKLLDDLDGKLERSQPMVSTGSVVTC